MKPREFRRDICEETILFLEKNLPFIRVSFNFFWWIWYKTFHFLHDIACSASGLWAWSWNSWSTRAGTQSWNSWSVFLTLWWLKNIYKNFPLIDEELMFVSSLTETYFPFVIHQVNVLTKERALQLIPTAHHVLGFLSMNSSTQIEEHMGSFPCSHGCISLFRGGLWSLVPDNEMWNRQSGMLP